MEYLQLLMNSFIDFFMLPVFTILPCLVYSKYKFQKQINSLYFLLTVIAFSVIDFLQNIIIRFLNETSISSYNTSTSSIGSALIIFLIILLLQYKGIPIYQAIVHMGGIYIITDIVNELYFSNIKIDISNLVDYTISLLVITFFSVSACSILFKLLNLFDTQKDKTVYGFSTAIIVSLFILGKNLVSIFFSSTPSINPETDIALKQLDNAMVDEVLATTNKAINADIFLFIVVIIFIFLLTILSNFYYKEQRIRLQTRRTIELENYIETIELIRDEVLSYQHDYDNIFTGISGYIYEDEIDKEKLQSYYEQSVKNIFRNEGIKVIKLLNLQNIEIPEIKGLLSQKILQARQKGIYVQLEVTEPVYELSMNKIDLTRCLGILLDNAIEAASISKAKQLTIAFVFVEKQLLLVIKNSIFAAQTLDDSHTHKKHFSSKKENQKHGFGLSNIQKIINKYEHVQLKTTILDNDFIQEIRIKMEAD